MKQGGCRTKMTGGFTIVETMIVLAVTGMIFLSAAVLINGKEAKVQFTTAVQNIQSQIQQTIGEVQSGYYPNNSNFKCLANNPNVSISSGTAQQGTNNGCIFLGKALQFGLNTPSNTPELVRVYSIAGNRQSGTGDVTSLIQASPTVVPQSTANISLRYGLTAVSVKVTPSTVCSGANRNSAVIAFMSSLASVDAGGNLLSGSQNVDAYPVCGTNIGDGDDTSTINSKLSGSTALGTLAPPGGVAVCFQSGTTKQSGLITIGGGNTGELAATLQIFSSQDCT
jgi:type II secretory pathway pseudopilin PulG